jgi:hypothetical protein
VINNRQHFKINSEIHNINTRNNPDLHYPQSHLSVYQKVSHYTGLRYLTGYLSHDFKQFKMALKGFVYLYFFFAADKHAHKNQKTNKKTQQETQMKTCIV